MSALETLLQKNIQDFTPIEHAIFRVYCEAQIHPDSDVVMLMANLAAAELAALQERVAELEARNKWWLENYDITMPCGHKNRYLAITGDGRISLDEHGNGICIMCRVKGEAQ